MKSWRNVLPLLTALALLPLASAQDDDADQDVPKVQSGETSSGGTEEDAVLSDIRMGEPMSGLRIPQYDTDGRLLSLFDIGTAKRIDDRHIALTKLKIQINNADGTTFHVEMEEAVFDLDTRVLESHSPTQIRREGFVIDGEAAQFHTKTRFGRMTGHIKMVIESDNIE